MTNKEITYELAECMITTHNLKGELKDELDVVAMALVEERLQKLHEHFKALYDSEVKMIDKQIDDILK